MSYIKRGLDRMKRTTGMSIDVWRKPNPLIAALLFFFACYSSFTVGQSDALRHGLTPVYGKPMSPELRLPGLDGKQYRLIDYRGKVVIVNFWATWCPPCIEEMPTLQKIWEQLHTANFEVLAVNVGEDEQTIKRFIDRFEPKLTFPILLTPDPSIMDTWRIRAMPTSYIIDKAGRWIYGETGPRDFSHEHIVSRVKKLMDE